VAGNINSPISNIALQWEKNVENAVSLAISRMSAGVEHDDKLDSSNPILSLKTQMRKLSLWSVIQPWHSLQEIFCESAPNTWRENKSCEREDQLCIHLQYHFQQSSEKFIRLEAR